MESLESPILKIPSQQKIIKTLYGLLFLLITWVIFVRCKKNIELNKKEKKDLIKIQISYMFCGILLIIGSLISLSITGISKFTIISLFSFIGIALGLSLQPIVSKIISSFELVFQNNYKIGDEITHLNPNSKMSIEGTILDFNLLNTTIQDINKKKYIIPNDMINNNIIVK